MDNLLVWTMTNISLSPRNPVVKRMAGPRTSSSFSGGFSSSASFKSSAAAASPFAMGENDGSALYLKSISESVWPDVRKNVAQCSIKVAQKLAFQFYCFTFSLKNLNKILFISGCTWEWLVFLIQLIQPAVLEIRMLVIDVGLLSIQIGEEEF